MTKEVQQTIYELNNFYCTINKYTSSQIDKTVIDSIQTMSRLSTIVDIIRTTCKEEDGYKSGEEGYEWTDGVREGRYSLAQEILELIKGE